MNWVRVPDQETVEVCRKGIAELERVFLFFSSGDCPPCARLHETFNRLLATENWKKDYVIYDIDAENAMELIREYKVMQVPTVFFISNGKRSDWMIGSKIDRPLTDKRIINKFKKFLGA